ncbi:MAG: TolC family protein, partial [Rikenellaceae bacterium]|nr:TolC family protein [Rikenellaceae bacterium]
MARNVNILIVALGALLCGSCMLGSKYKSPELNLPAAIADGASDSLSFADLKWWEVYPDTTLQKLIAKVLDRNKDMLIAASRVEELRKLQRINTAALLPSVGADVSADYEVDNYGGHNPDRTSKYNGKLQFRWELDLWGNLRWARQRGINDYLQSVEAQQALRMTLVAEVATAYFELVALDNELAIVRQTLATRQEGVKQTKLRFEGGLTSEISYRQAQVEVAKAATLIPELERRVTAKENEITLLAGEYPHRINRGVMLEE